MKHKVRLNAEIVSKDYDGILKWIDEIKKDIIHWQKYKDVIYPNILSWQGKKKEGAYFSCNKQIKKFKWES